MRKGEATRTAILAEATRQVAQRGLEGLALGPLADRLRLSKSGLFAHFKSKEALLLAVLEAAGARFAHEVTGPAMQQPQAADRLATLFESYLDWIEGGRDLPGCPFISLIVDLDARPGPARDRLVEGQASWRRLLADLVEAAQRDGSVRADLAPAQIAFELVGIALSYHVAAKLLDDGQARARARDAYRRLTTTGDAR
jgi:AcrR family transcriptional regulator